MPPFLSPAWIDALAGALDGAPPSPAASSATTSKLKLRHRIHGGPGGDVEFGVELGPDGPSIKPGPVADADVEVTQDYETAVAISRGTITPAVAFASGRVRMGGKVGLLTQHRDGLSAFADALAALRERTAY